MGTRKFRTPGSAQQSALESAKALMAERLKYEQWLDDLEAKKSSTPAKVFERVQKDYLERLQNVVEQLGKYTETLEQHAETLTGKLRDLQAMVEANEEEQAEQALRKQVGEISSAEWESSSKKAQKELAKIKENQETIEADLAQIRDLLGEEEYEEEEEAPAKGSKGSKEFNELEFLSSVVGQSTTPIPAAKPAESRSSGQTTSPKTPTPATGAAAAPAPEPRTTPTPAAGPPRATPGATPAAAAPPRVSNPAAPPAADQPAPAAAAAPPARTSNPPASAPAAPAAAASASEKPASPAAAAPASAPPPAAPPAAAASDEPPSLHRPTVATEQSKTLKCTECSTMNYATEWYCEKCGAELTGA